ncbi:MAG: PAS domain-containing protein [Vicinamibacterales bacterium]
MLRGGSGWNGDLFVVARPVQTRDRPRAAVAWIAFRPSAPPEAGSGAVVLALPVVIVLVATYLVAMLIGRRTLRALSVLNEDIELAVAGKLDTIGDPLGAKPVKDLADAVNYLVARLRAATSGAARTSDAASARSPRTTGGGRGSDTSSAAPAPADLSRGSAPSAAASRAPAVAPRLEARIVINTQFRVTEASPGCADLIGVRPDALLGAHVIDAIPDRQIGDAVMRCLSALPSAGEQTAEVTPVNQPYSLAIIVSRAGKEQPIAITFSAGPEVGTP